MNGCSLYDIEKLDRIQFFTDRIFTRSPSLACGELLYSKIGWNPFKTIGAFYKKKKRFITHYHYVQNSWYRWDTSVKKKTRGNISYKPEHISCIRKYIPYKREIITYKRGNISKYNTRNKEQNSIPERRSEVFKRYSVSEALRT